MSNPIYNPRIFDHADLLSARQIVLTPENGVATDVRWQTETPWLLNIIEKYVKPSSLIVDYGCGVGRLSAPLAISGHSVIGVDTSESMRQHATMQVSNERFVAMTPVMFDQFVKIGVRADIVLAIWMLQHTFDLHYEVERICNSMKKGASLVVADMIHRAIPTNKGWVSDGLSVKEVVSSKLTLVQQYPYNPPNAPIGLKDTSYVCVFRKDK